MRVLLFVSLVVVSFAFAPLSLLAQSAEIEPYAGYYWSGNNASGPGRFVNNQILGVRGGGYITPNFELGGNYSWSNHFQPNSSNTASNLAADAGFARPSIRGNLWEVEFTYNFGKRNLFGSSAVKPYVTAGLGGLTTKVTEGDTFVLTARPVITPNGRTLFVPVDVIDDGGATFFTFSYGGGIKAARLWGPWGFFGDVRGRTLPNFFGSATTRTEVSAGLNFTWGE